MPLLRADMKTLALKKMMGHGFLATTDINLYKSMRYEAEEYKKMGPLGSGSTGSSDWNK